MFRFVRGLYLFFIALSCGACVTYTDSIKVMREEYLNSKYDNALKNLESSSVLKQNNNRLLYLMEKSLILDRLQRKKESRSLLLEADKLADELYSKSISKEALTYVYNESAQEYSGEDYEKVAIHIMLALSFLDENDYNGALVEARKINNKLSEINSRYDKGKNRYSEDAFARYLSGLIYESKGEIDSAIIDYTKALELYEGIYSKEFDVPVPSVLVQDLYLLLLKRQRTDRLRLLEKRYPSICENVKKNVSVIRDMSSIVVIHELGSIAIKQAHDFYVPIKGNQLVRLSFPIIFKNTNNFNSYTGIKIGNDFYHAALVQYMDTIASKTLEDRRLRLILKRSARLIIKGQMQSQMQKHFGVVGKVAANVYNVVTETADTRGWTLLPSRFYITRVRVKPGNYKVTIISNSNIVDIKDINLMPKKIKIIRSVMH